WSCCRGPLQSQQHHFGGELSIQVCLACPGGDVGVDRGGAAVIANGQRDLLRAFGPGQIGVMRNCVERVALGPGGLDPDLQAHAIDHPMEQERSKPCPLKGAGRDGRRKGADLQGDQLGGGVDAVARAPQGQAGSEIKGAGFWPEWISSLAVKALKGMVGGGGTMATAIALLPTLIVSTTVLVAVSITETFPPAR